jgi:hypothetical protein
MAATRSLKRDLLMAIQYKVLIERSVARGDGSVSG